MRDVCRGCDYWTGVCWHPDAEMSGLAVSGSSPGCECWRARVDDLWGEEVDDGPEMDDGGRGCACEDDD